MANKQLIVIGPIASGKTTASQLVARELDLPLLDADLYEENPFLPSYIEDTPRWSFATELFFTIARIKKLKVLPRMLKKSSVVVDSGLVMSHQVYTKNHLVEGTMTAAEWDFFSRIIEDYKRDLPDPDIVIHLTCPPQIQLKRIASRGRSFESGYTLEYLQSVTDRLTEYAASLANAKNVTYLPFDTQEFDLSQEKNQQKLLNLVVQNLQSTLLVSHS